MTTITAPDAPGQVAAGLAARIAIPLRLPLTYKGTPLQHLSHSAISRYWLCPEDFRRSYILGEWGPSSGEQFLGSRVDDAISSFYNRQLQGEMLDLEQVKDLFNDRWKHELAFERDRHGGVRWGADTPAQTAHALGLLAIEMSFEQLVPRLGRPLAVQRRFELKIHPTLDWTIVGVADLDTVREQTVYVTDDGQAHPLIQDQGEPEPTVEVPYLEAPAELREPVKRGRETLQPIDAIIAYNRECDQHQAALAQHEAANDQTITLPIAPAPLPTVKVPVRMLAASTVTREVTGVVDYKVKASPVGDSAAARDMQAGLYLTERWLAYEPAFDFRFAQVAKPKVGRRAAMSTSLVATTRNERDMRRVLARFAQTAASICATYEQLGPDRPWGYANQEWKCDYCTYGPRGTNTCPFALAA